MNPLDHKLAKAIHRLIPEAKLKLPDDSTLHAGCICHQEKVEYWPPTLRHVLWAIWEVIGYVLVDSTGQFLVRDDVDNTLIPLGNPLFKREKPLYKQSNELKQWLLTLLTDE